MDLQAFQNHIQVMDLDETPSVEVSEDVVVDRQLAGFDPSFWGDYFITNKKSQSEAWMNERVKELKNEVRSMFQNVTGVLQTMNLIDTIQLLGLDYHFMEEIDRALDHLKDVDMSKYGIYEVALHFRLLRQKGFNISSDVFKKYKNKEGKFMEELKDDAKGLLSLYNAAYLGTKKETILDEAISFTKDNLTSLLKDLNPTVAKLVSLTLKTPIQRSMKRLFTRCYISIYQDEPTRNETILELAKLDFNILQCLHQEELKKVCMWWKKLNLDIMHLNFIRDRVVECYCWSMVIRHEPSCSRARLISTKDAFEWFATFPKIIEACAMIVRITNDITSTEREQKRVHVASTVDCYMKEYGTSKDVACEKLLGFVEDAWKTINEELLTKTGLSREVIELSLHSSRSTELIYKHVDAFTEPNTSMKENIFFLLVHPIPI
ncbi:(S)-beta-bisabolene synthase-like [Curcuma longa]|uniref:(S)-beta-bisabolene synthase-like n=1 Tax=Curcuma longa TaxID=136217 RepID=UPI003D9EFFC5